MAFRNVLRCYVCDRRFAPRLMIRIDGDENATKLEVAIQRRDSFNRPLFEVKNLTRICTNCNQSILHEIVALEEGLRLNVLPQTRNSTCLFCNNINDVHRLSIECKADVFIKQGIFISDDVR